MRKDRSPARPRGTSASSSRRNTARCSSTKSATCPLMMQAKLLRVLEESQVERVGGDRTIPVDVRVLVATHRNLDELVRKRLFRAGPLPSHLRVPAARCRPCASARRTSRCWWSTSRASSPSRTAGSRNPSPRKHRGAGAIPLAGQRARTAQRGGAPAAAGRRRGAGGRRAAGPAAERRLRWDASPAPPPSGR